MRVLIVEDEALIAMDLEDIVTDSMAAECLWARTLADGLAKAGAEVDFALLDVDLNGHTSIPVAERLTERRIPFCFVSGSLADLPTRFRSVPCIAKPFHSDQIRALLPRFWRTTSVGPQRAVILDGRCFDRVALTERGMSL
ncbi:response regulator [Aureimonas sp. AU12]|uniref:response regulator n=1 Tax=Aureimonas sp. AU12 TaxID=1638161 RepID=UPI000A6770ED|nr:response regulator [Aureimonas sp. AU12]